MRSQAWATHNAVARACTRAHPLPVQEDAMMRVPVYAAPAAALCGFLFAFTVIALHSPASHARRRGMVGYSGNPATNDGEDCTACHLGGFPPKVTLEGPSFVPPGAQRVFTLTVAEGQLLAAGLDVSVTAGFLQSLGPDTQVLEGELTHSNPKIVNPDTGAATFSFAWTAPIGEGAEVTMYGAGNSVNGDTTPEGDAPSLVVKQVLVSRSGPPPTPAPTATTLPTATPVAATPTDSPTSTPSPTETPGATETGTATPTGESSATPAIEPTATPGWAAWLPWLAREAGLR